MQENDERPKATFVGYSLGIKVDRDLYDDDWFSRYMAKFRFTATLRLRIASARYRLGCWVLGFDPYAEDD